jgi:hypothetical protein
MVSWFGCLTLVVLPDLLFDAMIAPSSQQHGGSGVLYPLAISVADAAGARVDRPDRNRLGAF